MYVTLGVSTEKAVFGPEGSPQVMTKGRSGTRIYPAANHLKRPLGFFPYIYIYIYIYPVGCFCFTFHLSDSPDLPNGLVSDHKEPQSKSS